jgi:hypothetical protein
MGGKLFGLSLTFQNAFIQCTHHQRGGYAGCDLQSVSGILQSSKEYYPPER